MSQSNASAQKKKPMKSIQNVECLRCASMEYDVKGPVDLDLII